MVHTIETHPHTDVDTTFHTRVTHCNIDLINVEAEIQAHRLELHALRFQQVRGILPKETRQRHGGAEDLFKVRGSGKSRSGIEAFHTPVLKLRPQASCSALEIVENSV